MVSRPLRGCVAGVSVISGPVVIISSWAASAALSASCTTSAASDVPGVLSQLIAAVAELGLAVGVGRGIDLRVPLALALGAHGRRRAPPVGKLAVAGRGADAPHDVEDV